MSDAVFNEQMDEVLHSVENVLPRKRAQVNRSIDGFRLPVADVLAKYESDGTIPTTSVKNVVDEVRALENSLYRTIQTEMRLAYKDIAEMTTESIAGALIVAFGIPAVLSAIGVATTDVLTNQAIFSAAVAMDVLQFIGSVVASVFNRTDSDGKSLNDRIRSYVRDLLRDITDTLRKNIMTGEVTATMLRNIKKDIDRHSWRVNTIVNTESMFAMRQSIAKFGETSDLVEAVKIVDFPHGDPKEHRRHKCYQYANADDHGLGKGVYPVSTRKIRNPHPQCRSVLHLLFIDDIKGGG